ncbi:septal ring lytic transglycosylase RlpA family protein [Labrys neptuniae]
MSLMQSSLRSPLRRRPLRVPDLRRSARAVLVAVIGAALSADHAVGAEHGLASWYQSGHRTASGEVYRPDGLTCARRRGRFGSMLRVTNLATGKSVVCRLNDRGPASWTGREIDLSRGSARQLGILSAGTARVKVEVLGK